MLCSQWLVTGVTCNDVRGAAGQHALNGSQIKRRVNQLSMMLKLGRITPFDSIRSAYMKKKAGSITNSPLGSVRGDMMRRRTMV